jgi:hypothetical protein
MKHIITPKFFFLIALMIVGVGLIVIPKNLLGTQVFLSEGSTPGGADIELSSPSSDGSAPENADSQSGISSPPNGEGSNISDNEKDPTKEFTKGEAKIVHFHFQEASDVNLVPIAGFISKDFDEAILLHEDALGQ